MVTAYRTAALVGLVLCVCLESGSTPVSAQTSGSSFSPQQMLDLLAKPIPAGSRMGLPADYPNLYQSWTDLQKQSGLQAMGQRCVLMYSLEGDNPKAHLLPETMTKREAAELALSVCLPAKMPVDWPERSKYLSDAQRLLAKANSQGAGLHLPENLSRGN
jgi:hypothetical protein